MSVSAANVYRTWKSAPSRETLKRVPVPWGPPATAAPYRYPSAPSVNSASGYAPSVFSGFWSAFVPVAVGKRWSTSKPVPVCDTLNTVPVDVAVPEPPKRVVP